MNRKQEAILAKLSRNYGMRSEQKQQIADVNSKLVDWHTTCRKCGKKRTGTITELSKSHGCAL